MPQFTALPPLSLYVHFPWCIRKCPYCDFNSHAVKKGFDEAGYINALLADLEQDLPDIWGRPVRTVFFGGGTPSLFSPQAMDSLLSGVRARLVLAPDAEITLETNPGTTEHHSFEEYLKAGINRLSFGIQSFDNRQLKTLGRIHSAEEATRAVIKAKEAGFTNFNLDLMFGLPGQMPEDARKDVEAAIALNPTHISYYHLTIEPNTFFHQFPPTLPEDDVSWEIQAQGQALLAAAGYEHYEVSAHARPGFASRHNINYWTFGDYLGIGAGAHGKISKANESCVLRRWKAKHPDEYLRTAATPARIAGENRVKDDELLFEFLMNALRLDAGFGVDTFTRHTGLAAEVLLDSLHVAASRGLLEWDQTRQWIRPTPLGQNFLNDLLALFLPESA